MTQKQIFWLVGIILVYYFFFHNKPGSPGLTLAKRNISASAAITNTNDEA